MATGYARDRGNGKWQLEVNLGSYVDPDTGKKKRNRQFKTINAKGKRDAERQLAKFVSELEEGSYKKEKKINFVDFVENYWYPHIIQTHELASTTLDTYMRYLRLRIIPVFKALRMDQVTPEHINEFLAMLSEDGMRMDDTEGTLSVNTIFYHRRILNNVFNYAVKKKVISESPVKDAVKPRVPKPKVEIYEDEDSFKLVQALDSEPLHWRIAIKLMITCGMRRSEVFGLDLDKHIDLEKNVIHIEQAMTYAPANPYDIHPIKKGEEGEQQGQRDAYISNLLLDDIKKLKAQRDHERSMYPVDELWEKGKHNLLLAHPDGTPYLATALNKWWKRFIKRHDLKYIKPHALRHTYASILINEGYNAKIVATQLGHANTKTTLNVYSHMFRSTGEDIAHHFDEMFNHEQKK